MVYGRKGGRSLWYCGTLLYFYYCTVTGSAYLISLYTIHSSSSSVDSGEAWPHHWTLVADFPSRWRTWPNPTPPVSLSTLFLVTRSRTWTVSRMNATPRWRSPLPWCTWSLRSLRRSSETRLTSSHTDELEAWSSMILKLPVCFLSVSSLFIFLKEQNIRFYFYFFQFWRSTVQDLVGSSCVDATEHPSYHHPPESQCLVCLFRAINAPLRVKKQILNPNVRLFSDDSIMLYIPPTILHTGPLCLEIRFRL